MADFLLELLCEEMPARMQAGAIKQLHDKLLAAIDGARLTYDSSRSFVTPRRLAVIVTNLPDVQPDQTIERKGPKTSAPDKAIDGFCNSCGVSKEQLEIRSTGKGDVYFAVTCDTGKPAIDALQQCVSSVLNDFHWPKSMRWADYSQQWVRPLRNVLCVLGSDVVPVTWGHLDANNITRGHRFMSDNEVVITQPDDYVDALHTHYVIADAAERKRMICEQIAACMHDIGCNIRADDGLLDEVNGLVEHPTALCGTFDASYLSLPPEVLVLEMRHHQKYFAVTRSDGSLSNHFVTIANIKAGDGGQHIINGNERVLRARLDDGMFYWNQDRKRSLTDWAKGLSSMVFHQQLGSVADKVERISALAKYLAVFISHANIEHVERAAHLCKADLTTGMVGEFPELQGVMGRYYALEQGEAPEVADAICHHYKPVGASDDVPEGAVAIALSLADKFDSLSGLFAAGEVPTGSKDPYALRRAALGIIRIIRAHSLRIPIEKIIKKALSYHDVTVPDGTHSLIVSFIIDRLKTSLKDEDIRYDVLDAVLHDHTKHDIVRIVARAEALQAFLASDDGENAVIARARASNIVAKEEKVHDHEYSANYSHSDMIQPEEKQLASAIDEVKPQVDKALKSDNYQDAMQALSTLRKPMDAFFEHVQVNTPEEKIRENRLRVCAAVKKLFAQIADFDALEG